MSSPIAASSVAGEKDAGEGGDGWSEITSPASSPQNKLPAGEWSGGGDIAAVAVGIVWRGFGGGHGIGGGGGAEEG